jgi:hypothetical protein
MATAGLILGILSLCTGPLLGVPALICSAIALSRPGGRGKAVAGLCLGFLGSGLALLLLLPAVFKVREAATRMKDANNLKIVGIAMHADADRHHSLSSCARDDFGRVQTGLSLRVGMLPYMEQHNLYRRFDLTQPWDGEKNRSLSNTPLAAYTTPYDGPEPSVDTPYRVFVGGGALFNEDGKPVRFPGEVTDGTSNTIMAVHATEQVPWAEPRELVYGPNLPLPKLGHPSQSGAFQVLMADGSVRTVSGKVSEKTLRALITRNGGEVLGNDW